jgi:hypothetical protein
MGSRIQRGSEEKCPRREVKRMKPINYCRECDKMGSGCPPPEWHTLFYFTECDVKCPNFEPKKTQTQREEERHIKRAVFNAPLIEAFIAKFGSITYCETPVGFRWRKEIWQKDENSEKNKGT